MVGFTFTGRRKHPQACSPAADDSTTAPSAAQRRTQRQPRHSAPPSGTHIARRTSQAMWRGVRSAGAQRSIVRSWARGASRTTNVARARRIGA